MDELNDIEIEKIDVVDNSRIDTENADIASLMVDIKQRGMIHPITVYREGNRFVLQVGHRRLIAAKKAGWTKVPAIITSKPSDELESISKNIAENIQRVGLDDYEIMVKISNLLDSGYNREEISSALNISDNKIKTLLSMKNNLPKTITDNLRFKSVNSKGRRTGKLSPTLAGRIAQLRYLTKEKKAMFCEYAKRNSLSTRDIDKIGYFIKRKKTMEEAVELADNYTYSQVYLMVSKKVLEKYGGRNGASLFRDILQKKLPIYDGLVL